LGPNSFAAVLSLSFAVVLAFFVLWFWQIWAIESQFLVVTPLGEFVGSKGDLLAERTFYLVW